MKRKLDVLFILLVAICGTVMLLAGCASVVAPVRIVPAEGMPHYSPTVPASVTVLRSEPPRPPRNQGSNIRPMDLPPIMAQSEDDDFDEVNGNIAPPGQPIPPPVARRPSSPPQRRVDDRPPPRRAEEQAVPRNVVDESLVERRIEEPTARRVDAPPVQRPSPAPAPSLAM